MDERQKEYEFFLRVSNLFEARAAELAKIGGWGAEHLAKQAIEDARNAALWAERIKAGWVVAPGDEVEAERYALLTATKVTYSWLKDYVKNNPPAKSEAELVNMLANLIREVESE